MARAFLFQADELRSYIFRVFRKLDIPEEHAYIAADILLSADLRGVSSHGITRLFTYYGNGILHGLINPASPYQVLHETQSTLHMDGGNGLGMVVAYKTMQRVIQKAKLSGVALAAVRSSNHFGIAGYYAMMALQEDMIGISFTNAQALVAPTYGRTPLLGTNPIAVAVPALHERPFVLDMATSIVPIGKISVHSQLGQDIPAGWGVDKSGLVTTNPQSVLEGGALLPLGGIDLFRGYKGYGLALLVDIFSGILSGAATSPHVGSPVKNKVANVGHFFAAFRIDSFRDPVEFKTELDLLLRTLKDSPKSDGEDRIYIHGEKEFEAVEKNLRQGVPISAGVVASLQEADRVVGVPFSLPVLGEIDI